MFAAQERAELRFADATAKAAAFFAKTRVFQHFGKKTGLKFLGDAAQGLGVLRRGIGARGGGRAGLTRGGRDRRNRISHGDTSD
jgi:hypothetical protein